MINSIIVSENGIKEINGLQNLNNNKLPKILKYPNSKSVKLYNNISKTYNTNSFKYTLNSNILINKDKYIEKNKNLISYKHEQYIKKYNNIKKRHETYFKNKFEKIELNYPLIRNKFNIVNDIYKKIQPLITKKHTKQLKNINNNNFHLLIKDFKRNKLRRMAI